MADVLKHRAWPWLIAAVLVAVLFLAVFPTKTWLAQRQEIQVQEQRIHVLRAESERLEARLDELQTPEEIERLARAEYNMVRPGEEAYAMLPGPKPPEAEEAAGGAERDAESEPEETREDRSLVDRVTAFITFWD